MFQRVLIMLAAISLSACKLVLEVPEGGYISSQSGIYDCYGENPLASASLGEERFRQLAGSGASAQHEENAHCEIDISDTSFSEAFTAVPYDGYVFLGWAEGQRYLFGGTRVNPAPVWTVGFDSFPALLELVNSGITYTMEPIFALDTTQGTRNCDAYTGSFDRIQDIVFEGYNCTNSACHAGSNPAGNLDLTDGVAYDNLFRVDANAPLVEPMQLVYPGEQKFSFLYSKLEAATLGTELPQGGGTRMPVAGSPLSEDHLAAMRAWIRGGAPETGDVDDVATLLGCDQPTEPQANKIAPPDPPPEGEGVQFVSGPWTVLADSENEVCYATYYDLEKTPGLLPEWARAECEGGIYSEYDGECFAYKTRTLTQDPQSHHSIIDAYVGAVSPHDPSWGSWQCLNGPNEGMACDPTRIGEPVAQGGADCGGSTYVCGTVAQRSIACTGWGANDHRFRSVSMGGSQSVISTETLADGVYSLLPTRAVIIWNSHAFNLSDEDTTVEQYNDFLFAPQEERVYRNRGIFDSRFIFVADVPPFQERTYCASWTMPEGSRLTQLSSHAHKRGVEFDIWLPPQDPSCRPATGCEPNTTEPDYVSRVYDDPLYLDYEPPLPYDGAAAEDRTIKYCVTYDNGLNFPELLKRNSTSVGTTCHGNAYCVGGTNEGAFCGNNDSACGGGGSCDACVVNGGFTTEDEMFILLGSYYIVPPEERN